jgi:hypothetical protein
MRFVQKVRPVYIDANGNDQSYPAESLPFDLQTFGDAMLNIAVGGQGEHIKSAADWGVGLSFFIRYAVYQVQSTTTDFFTLRHHGIRLQLSREGGTAPVTLYKDIHAYNTPLIQSGANNFSLYGTWNTNLFKIDANQQIRARIWNRGGAIITNAALELHGVVI